MVGCSVPRSFPSAVRSSDSWRRLPLLLLAGVLVGFACCWPASAASAPAAAIELRVRGLDVDQAAGMLAQQGFRDPAAAARVLISADYEPVAVERALIGTYQLRRDAAVSAVRSALAAHAAVAGTSLLRPSVCYLRDGTLVDCPRPAAAMAPAAAADPAVAALLERVERLEAAAADTVLRQALRIRDLEQALAAGPAAAPAVDQQLVLTGSRRERIDQSAHLTVGESRYEKLGGSLHQIVGQHRLERIGGNLGLRVDDRVDLLAGSGLALQSGLEISLKAGLGLVLESATGITLKSSGNYITIDASGISVNSGGLLQLRGGSDILMSQAPTTGFAGGSAGSGHYPTPGVPQAPQLPD